MKRINSSSNKILPDIEVKEKNERKKWLTLGEKDRRSKKSGKVLPTRFPLTFSTFSNLPTSIWRHHGFNGHSSLPSITSILQMFNRKNMKF